MHLYTNNTHSREDSVNLDFDLAQSMQKVTNPNGSISCIVHKSFSNFAVSEAGIGQYATPGGKCCEIIWSRFYVFDVSLPLK